MRANLIRRGLIILIGGRYQLTEAGIAETRQIIRQLDGKGIAGNG